MFKIVYTPCKPPFGATLRYTQTNFLHSSAVKLIFLLILLDIAHPINV
jgi:hypothetical protein